MSRPPYRPRRLVKVLVALLALPFGCSGQISQEAERPSPKRSGGSTAGTMPASGTPAQPGTAPAEIPSATGTGGKPGAMTAMPGQPMPMIPTSVPAPPSATTAQASPFRRLTRVEYVNAVADLLAAAGVTVSPSAFPEEGVGLSGFLTADNVEMVDLQRYLEFTESLPIKNLKGLMGCDVVVGDDVKCVSDWLPNFGRRAYRRPLTPAELTDLRALYASLRTRLEKPLAVETLIRSILVSPHVVYLVEGLSATKGAGAAVALTPFEVAARMALFIWSSIPDDPLLATAETNALSTPAQIEAQARRMLADNRATRTIRRFHREWLEMYNPSLPNDINDPILQDETNSFTSFVILKGDGLLKTLFTAPFTFAFSGLAKHYGVAALPKCCGAERVDLPPGRAGLLMQSGFLNSHSSPTSSPVRRGVTLLKRVLCQEPPAPPMDIPPPPPVTSTTTTRQRLEQHRANPACGGCHALIDPPGFAFEAFDALGRYRETEAGKPIDAKAEIRGTLDLDGTYEGALPFVEKLAGSRQVSACLAREWFRFALGRRDDLGDADDLKNLSKSFGGATANIRDLLVATTLTQSFGYRRTVAVDLSKGGRP